MSELKITKDGLENAILKDGLLAFGKIEGWSGHIDSSGNGAFAFGYVHESDSYIKADGDGAFAGGYMNNENSYILANGNGAFAFGYVRNGSIYVNGNGAHAEGIDTLALADGAHAEGINTNALNDAAHAEGEGCYEIKLSYYGGIQITSLRRSGQTTFLTDTDITDGNNIYNYNTKDLIAIINDRESPGEQGYAYKFEVQTTELANSLAYSKDDQVPIYVTNLAPHPYKNYITLGASGYASHTEGINTQATAEAAHAGGIGTIANKEAMTAIGKYNSVDTSIYGDNTLFVIGNGNSSTTRKNVLNINNNGKIYFNNNYVYFNNYGSDNNYIKSNENDLVIGVNDELILLTNKVTINADDDQVTINSYTKISNIVTAKVNNVENVQLGLPIGSITMWAGETVPDGWLLCDGRCIPTNQSWTETRNVEGNDYSIYQNLLNVIKKIYGYTGSQTSSESVEGDTVTGHRVAIPNLQLKFPLGAKYDGTIGKNGHNSDSPGWNTSIGSIGGEPTNTLDIKEMPAHNHSLEHFSTSSSSGYIDYTGGGNAHNNMPPFLALNFIIKYK